MTKNTKLGVWISILAIILLIVVLSSTVFCVNSVTLVWYNSPIQLTGLTNNNVLSASQSGSTSVFVLDKEKTIKNIEEQYNYLKVLKVETVWPNKLKIHIKERQAVYIFAVGSKYVITDEYLKVLQISHSYSNTQQNAVQVLDVPGLSNNVQVGDSIAYSMGNSLTDLYNGFISYDRSISDLMAICKNITISTDTMQITTHLGITIKIDNPYFNTATKTRMALATLEELSLVEYSSGTMEVFVNSAGDVESRWY